ncbi:MAG: hypothetical protein AAF125_24415, partial [Chloroflexota bacterium]
MRRLADLLATVVAMSVGFIMTIALLYDGVFTGGLGVLMSANNLDVALQGFVPAATRIIQITTTLAIVIGLLNLLLVHTTKLVQVRQYRLNALWSLLLLVCAVGVILVALLEGNG